MPNMPFLRHRERSAAIPAHAPHGSGLPRYARNDKAVTSSFKTLAALTGAVVVAHLVVLQGTSMALQASDRAITRPFSTRMIEFKPVVQTPADAGAAKATQAAPKPTAVPRPRKPAVVETTQIGPQAVFTPVSEPNMPAAPAEQAETATNTVATAGPEPASAEATKPTPPASSPIVQTEPAPPAAAQTSTPPPLPAPLRAFTLPGSIRIKYNLTGLKDNLTYHARGEILWLHDGKTYDARMEVSLFLLGSRVRTSTGTITAEGLAPTRFADKFRSEVAAHFDRDKQRVTFSANTPDRPLLPGAQDQLSVIMQLGAMLAGEPARYTPGTSITFETIGPRDVETWVVTVEGEEKLSLPGGDIMTIKLTRGARREFDQKTELWLAPTLGYLPARIKITDRNNDFVDQVWRATEAP